MSNSNIFLLILLSVLTATSGFARSSTSRFEGYAMLYLTALSAAFAAALLAYVISLATPARAPRTVRDRMMSLGLTDAQESARRIRRSERRRQLEQMITLLGERLKEGGADYGPLRERLIHAGYRTTSALALFLGVRVVLTVGLARANEFGGMLLFVGSFW